MSTKAKNTAEMTHEELIEHHRKEREKASKERDKMISHLSPDMIQAVKELKETASSVGETMQFEGSEYVWVSDMHKLIDRANSVNSLFNFDVEERG